MHWSTPKAWLGAGILLLCAALPAAGSVDSEIAFHRGVAAYGDKNYAEARRQFEIVLEEDAEDTVAIHYLGLVAQGEGDPERALALYEQGLAIDPEDTDLIFDRGLALLDLGRNAEARDAFHRVIELEPDRARAHLFAGIAAYRMGDYHAALPELDRAGELDPELTVQAHYYTGLSEAFLGDLPAAEGAFSAVEEQSPLSPLGRSASNLREQVKEKPERRWQLTLASGIEWDSNPTVAGRTADQVDDYRGIFRASARYRAVSTDQFTITGGFDGYWSIHEDAHRVDLQTDNPWVSTSYRPFANLRLTVRYDYAFSLISMTDPFRHLHRVTPSMSYREGNWGLTQAYYQYNYLDFEVGSLSDTPLDRDGTEHTFGVTQFFFPPEPVSYFRVGGLGDLYDAEGTEFSYHGFEFFAGTGLDLPFEFEFTALYRFIRRDYQNPSVFSLPALQLRDDFTHRLNVELTRNITEHLSGTLGGAFTWNESNVNFYDYNREIFGAYLSYQF